LFSEGPLNAALVAAAIRDFLAGNRRLRVNHAGCATREQPVITVTRCRNVALFLCIWARGAAIFQKLAAPDSELSYYDWPLDKQTVLACGDSTEINELPA
jgi:hypothetical protein